MTIGELLSKVRAFFSAPLNAAEQAITHSFGPVEREAEAVVTKIEHVAQTVEEELTMSVPQNVSDAIARIKALLSGQSDQSAADAKTISDLRGQIATLTSASAAKDEQIATLQQQLSDATGQLTDIESAILALAPAPAQ